jgi:hypothetical protein
MTLTIGTKVVLTYRTGRTLTGTVEWDDTTIVGKSTYDLADDGTFRKLRIAADGGTVLAVSDVLGTWAVAT